MQFQIVGGGIAGASIAYHLVKDGHDVTVYDRSDKGQATQVSAGIISPWVSQRRNKLWYQLVRTGAAYYPTFIKELEDLTGSRTGYQRTGAVLFFRDEEVLPKAYKRILSKQQDAPEMGELSYLTPERQREFFPQLTTEFPSLFLTGAGMVNGAQLLDALKKAIVQLDGKWISSNAEPEPGQGITIYAGGAWGNEYQKKVPISHQRAQLLHFTLDSDKVYPVVMGLKTHYIVSFGNGRFAIGTTHEDTESFDSSPTEEAKAELVDLAKMYFPGQELKELEMAVGLRPYTPNFLPVIEYVNEQTIVVNGLGSSGLTAAPILGKELSANYSNKPVRLPLEAFRLEEGTDGL